MIVDRRPYKLMVLNKVPYDIMKYYKNRRNLNNLEIEIELPEEEHIEEIIEVQEEQSQMINKKMPTRKETEKVCEYVTNLDVKYELGVEAMQLILTALREGATIRNAIKIADSVINKTIAKREKKK